MPANETVTVILKIEADPAQNRRVARTVAQEATAQIQAAKQSAIGSQFDVRQVATRAAENVNKSHETASRTAIDAVSRRGAARGAGAADALGMGGLARVAGPIAAVAAAIKTVEGVSNAVRIAGERYMTSEQKGRELFKSLPGGETAQRIIDNFTGRQVAMQEVEINRQRMAVTRENFKEQTAFNIQAQPILAGLNERARQTAGRGPVLMDNIDRRTAAGELEFRQRSRLLPVEREIRKAEIEQAAASKSRAAAQQEVNYLADQEVRIQRVKMQGVRYLEANVGSGPERQQKLADLENVNKQLQDNQRLKQQAAQSLMESQTREAEARRQTQQQRAQLTEARAENAEDIARTAAGGARRIGGMNPFERAFSFQAVQAVQRYGPDAVPPEMLAAAQSVAPETIGKVLETRGVANQFYQRFQEIAPADFGTAGKSPEELRRSAQGLRNQAEQQRVSADVGFTGEAAAAGKEMARANMEAFRVLLNAYKLEIETSIRMAKGQQ